MDNGRSEKPVASLSFMTILCVLFYIKTDWLWMCAFEHGGRITKDITQPVHNRSRQGHDKVKVRTRQLAKQKCNAMHFTILHLFVAERLVAHNTIKLRYMIRNTMSSLRSMFPLNVFHFFSQTNSSPLLSASIFRRNFTSKVIVATLMHTN